MRTPPFMLDIALCKICFEASISFWCWFISDPRTNDPPLSDQKPSNSAETSILIKSPSSSIFLSDGIP
jgi:hypothetical protein